MENQMTIDQVLKITVEKLEGLMVPVGLMEEIGIPLAQAISNIRLCIQAVEASRADAESKQAEEKEDEGADAE